MLKNKGIFRNIIYRFIKRSFDIIGSVLLLPLVFLLILVSIIIIKLEDKGTLFYMADRTGRFGKPFKMFKIRSMKVDAPDIRLSDGSTYSDKNDSRITKYGEFIRKTSLDEIPQIINVLKGDMTFIGPRPDTPMYLDKYTEEEKIILTVRPGITGYNQAINRNAVGTKEKLANDIYYVNHMSVLFDIKIIFMTINVVLNKKNIYRSDEQVQKSIDKNLGEKNV
ncbi:sugar transferase [Enterococcus hulanensis]|uniref:sugar transferase n=1 Tax=Enterococcus hulanensis TaxID=2559929 RepID=UPI001A8E4892|nr:sugar transferase [Enterococcus hulanensis]MBO0455272.1 sugar transferase [Enterococcus hulanensis]